MRRHSSRRAGAWAGYGCALAAGLLLAYFELHTDDTGLEVALILLAAFVSGCWHPPHAWRWALLIGLPVPVAELCRPLLGLAPPPLHGSLASVAAVVMVLALAGSYAGALLRAR